jgi:hypothetical protein
LYHPLLIHFSRKVNASTPRRAIPVPPSKRDCWFRQMLPPVQPGLRHGMDLAVLKLVAVEIAATIRLLGLGLQDLFARDQPIGIDSLCASSSLRLGSRIVPWTPSSLGERLAICSIFPCG